VRSKILENGCITMAKKPSSPEPQPAQLSQQQIAEAIPKIERRLGELKAINVDTLTEANGDNELDSVTRKINATLRNIFGASTIEYNEYEVSGLSAYSMIFSADQDTSFRARSRDIKSAIASRIRSLETLLDILREQLEPSEQAGGNRILRAYEGLDLHKDIARAASRLYLDGYFANAVEAAVKALNNLVRLRSGLEVDGTTLMERAFNPTNPALKFNALADQYDKDEQKGYMMLFSGAVAGLRNPRAHKFIQDDPERALEFIAFVSLLAKILDQVH
jgi:uncharacterized protein (TIGR02391 family)